KAAAVLRCLTERAGQVVSKEELFAAVWPDTVVSDAALTTCIQEVRQALHDNARHPRYIETVHRRGFRFLEKVVRSQNSGASSQEEERQNTTGEDGAESGIQHAESNGQGFESVMPAFQQNSGQASAAMTPPPATSQNNLDGGRESEVPPPSPQAS